MRSARSAKVVCALGATLIAGGHLTIASAETGSGVSGITQGGVNGITQAGVQGITQGGVQGITQAGTQGITQAGVTGITQAGVQGITQAGVTGITQAGIQGITQGGVTGITQAGAQGITQAGVTGITQAGIQGITQAGTQGITQAGVTGITQAGIQGITQAGLRGITQGGVAAFDSLVLAGPVDSIDPINGVFTAVGQTVMASQGMLSSMNVGDFVSVNGSVVSSGWLYADSVSVSNDLYVPGATPVYVTGIPSEIDPVLGQARLGALTIDYTAAMSGGAIPAGLSLGFGGIQPVNRGLLVSDAVSAVQ